MVLIWLVGLFSLSLLMSQTAIDLFAVLIILQVLWMGFRWREQRSMKRLLNPVGIDWLFLVWIVIVIIGYANQGFAGDNWYVKLLEFRWLIVFYMFVTALRQTEPDTNWIKVGAVGFGLCSLWAIVIWFLGFDPIHPYESLQLTGGGVFRTGGFFTQPISFAHMYQLPLCILLGCFFSMVRWRERGAWIVGLGCLLGVIAIILSFTRGVWISLTVASLVMAFLYSRRLAIMIAIAGVVAFAGAYQILPSFKERIRYTLEGGDAERIWMWKANFEMFKDHPVIGIGYGENIGALTSYYQKLNAPADIIAASSSHAHNQYLQMLAGTGILGLAIYLIIVFYFLVLALRVWRKVGSREVFYQGLTLGVIGAQVAFLVGGLTEANLEHSKMRHALLFVWALTVWLAYEFNVLREKITSR